MKTEPKREECKGSAAGAEPELGMSLTDIHMSVSRAFHSMNNLTRPCARSLGLGQGQPRILSYIAVHGVSTQREIATFYSIDPSAVSRLLDPLERNGFLVSVPGRDRRTRALDITDKGTQALRAWEHECREVDKIMLKGFTDAESAQLMDLLERLRGNLAEVLAARQGRPAGSAAATPTTPASNAGSNLATPAKEEATDHE